MEHFLYFSVSLAPIMDHSICSPLALPILFCITSSHYGSFHMLPFSTSYTFLYSQLPVWSTSFTFLYFQLV